MSKHQERQLNRITGAVLNIVERDGFGQLNMASIAQEAGLTRQTIYNYFSDVGSIISAVIDQHIEAMEAHLREVVESAEGFDNKLLGVADFMFAVASEGHQQVSLEMGLSGEQRKRIGQQYNAIKSLLIESQIRDYPRNGGKESRDLGAEIDVLWGMMEGAAAASRHHPQKKGELLNLVSRALSSAMKSTSVNVK